MTDKENLLKAMGALKTFADSLPTSIAKLNIAMAEASAKLNKVTEDLAKAAPAENTTRLSVRKFCEKYVGRNTSLYLYTVERRIYEGNVYNVVWVGMDWQAAYAPGDLPYFDAHPDVEKCPYENWEVIQVIGTTEGHHDDLRRVALVIKSPTEQEEGDVCQKETILT